MRLRQEGARFLYVGNLRMKHVLRAPLEILVSVINSDCNGYVVGAIRHASSDLLLLLSRCSPSLVC